MEPPTDAADAADPPPDPATTSTTTPTPQTFALPSLGGAHDWLFDNTRPAGVAAAPRPPDDATRFKKQEAGGSASPQRVTHDGVERVSFVSKGSGARSVGFRNALPTSGEREENRNESAPCKNE